MKSLNRLQPLGLLALRVVLGIIFFAHGYPKLAHVGSGMKGFRTARPSGVLRLHLRRPGSFWQPAAGAGVIYAARRAAAGDGNGRGHLEGAQHQRISGRA